MDAIKTMPNEVFIDEPLGHTVNDVGLVLLLESFSELHTIHFSFARGCPNPDVRADLPVAPHGSAVLKPPKKLGNHDKLILAKGQC